MGLDLKQIILILLIVLLLFGAKRIPELARKIGEGINEFKKGMSSSGENENSYLAENTQNEIEEKDITPPPKALPKETTPKKSTKKSSKTAAKKSTKTTKTAKASTSKSRKS